MWTPAEKLVMATQDRRLLETWTRAHNAPQRVVMRCHVVLLAADGLANNAIAKALGISRPTEFSRRSLVVKLLARHNASPDLLNAAQHRGPAAWSRGRSAVREVGEYREYVTDEQRHGTGCIGGRMPAHL